MHQEKDDTELHQNDWISWSEHPAPEDVRGFFIKYEDGIYVDESKILGWRFMDRRDPSEKTIQCNDKNGSSNQTLENFVKNSRSIFEDE